MKICLGLLVAIVLMGGFYLSPPRPPLSLNYSEKADSILIEKGKREMSLFKNGQRIRKYKIALGSSPTGPKSQEGDGKTPEGTYTILSKKSNSAYHLSLKISYPSTHDREVAQSMNVNPGGDIMIHGLRNGLGWIGAYHTLRDWTRGCIAVTNDEIEEIYGMVQEGTPVRLIP